MKPDLFEAPDYYNLDDLLNDEHKLVRDAARKWVKREVSLLLKKPRKSRISQANYWWPGRNWCFWALYPRRIWRCWA